MDASTKRLIAQLRFRQLSLICTLMDTGSLRTTADRLHVTAPAVSSNVLEVERLLGFALFERLPQGMRPTPAGKTFIQAARQILDAIGTAATSGSGRQPAGWTVRLGTPSYMGGFLLPRLLGQLHSSASSLRIRHSEGRVFSLMERLYTGELDVVVVLGTSIDPARASNAAVRSEPLYRERFVVVGAPIRSARLGTLVNWDRLAQESWIAPPAEFMQRLLVDSAMLQQGLLPRDAEVETPSQLAAMECAADDRGITVLPMSIVASSIKEGRLAIVDASPSLPDMPVELAYREPVRARAGFDGLRSAIRNCLACS
jgi:DNA-binding transcriptional LysR family regulator